jgi:hypothetical protein
MSRQNYKSKEKKVNKVSLKCIFSRIIKKAKAEGKDCHTINI